jgi:hypothetical protein
VLDKGSVPGLRGDISMKKAKKASKQDSFANIGLVVAMYTGTFLITCSGALFLVYSFARNIHINISSFSIPGFVIALLMLFFGVRSFFSVRKFSLAILKNPPHLSTLFRKNSLAKGKSA